MSQKKQELFVVTEGQYSATTWCDRIIEGLYKEASRRNLRVCIRRETDLVNLPDRSVVVLLGSSFPFIESCIDTCFKHNFRPLIAGLEMLQNKSNVSYITFDRRQAMAEMVKNLIFCGAKRIALLGVNSSIQTDMLRYEGWISASKAYDMPVDESDVFYSDNGARKCISGFLENYKKYDAVACTNDYYAICLLSEAAQKNILVPDELMITGFGNIHLSQYTSPALTTVALNFNEVGTQVVNMYLYLKKNPELQSCSYILRSQIIARETTKKPHIRLGNKNISPGSIGAAFEPSYEKGLSDIYSLENAVVSWDETDYKIIRGLLSDLSYEALSENLFLSETAFKYRLHKLFHATGTNSRQSLIGTLQKYAPKLLEYGEDI